MNKKCESCQSCLMPFKKDKAVRESDIYCSYCYKNGALCYLGNNIKEFQAICFENMRKNGTPYLLAKFFTYMIKYAPRWKNK